MCMALVSVTRKPSWREEYIRSAEKYSAQVPVVAHFYVRSGAVVREL